jgi:hypothetical protein
MLVSHLNLSILVTLLFTAISLRIVILLRNHKQRIPRVMEEPLVIVILGPLLSGKTHVVCDKSLFQNNVIGNHFTRETALSKTAADESCV